MTQVTAPPQSMPVIAPSQAAAAPGAAAESDPGEESGVDFAAVLQKQMAQPAKDARETEIIAARLPSAPAADAEEASLAEEVQVDASLAALLAELMPPASAGSPIDPGQQSVAPVMTAATNAPPIAVTPAIEEPASFTTELTSQSMPGRPGTVSAPDAADPMVPFAAADPHMPLASANPNITAAMAGPHTTVAAADPQMPVATAENASPLSPVPSAASLAQTAQAGTAAPALAHVSTPVGGRGWDAEIGQKIVLMVNRQDSRAELTLTPPQLGKVEVTISMNGDQTSATFVSASPAAREALEQALPRLREILADAGITLGQASVNEESAQRGRDGSPSADHGGGRVSDAAREADSPSQWLRSGNGLIDTFA
ncbi:MAG: hypothetical protein CVU20_11300 [Betaproteobacteria bacterium HGW-Betaproteobacteria-14]|nr:MAG: hypothetical protein CVU20_11300 [Betaproteobacteria bacterium HGW-Betaproteobacteria-14]